jgi:N-methylhydantoinase A/oxoprolinase/acetone carboxylase beta subunit
MDLLRAGNVVDGPAIIEHSMTTFVIPPRKCAEFDEHKVIWYWDK